MKNWSHPRFKATLATILILACVAAPAFAREGATSSMTHSLDETAGAMPVIITDGLNEKGDIVLTIQDDGKIVVASEETRDAAATEEHAGEEHEKTAGFPQLDPTSYSSQVFWLFVSFIVLYTLMSRMALPRVTEVLDMRQTQKNSNLDRAEQLQDEAEKVKTAYEAALGEAHDKAEVAMKEADDRMTDKITKESERFAEEARKRAVDAESRIADAKKKALEELADISADVAVDIVRKVTDVSIQKADAQKAVQTALKNAA